MTTIHALSPFQHVNHASSHSLSSLFTKLEHLLLLNNLSQMFSTNLQLLCNEIKIHPDWNNIPAD